MLTITENIADASARRPAIGTLRMRLKPAHRSCGFVQGAWWPRSTELTSELPSLLAALSLRVGSIDSVLYHESDWSPAPLSIKHQGDQVILGAHQEWPNVVSLFGPRFGRLDLLVVPPYTEPAHAYNAVMTAASVNDASTPDQLLGMAHAALTIACSPPSRCSDGNPTEAQYQHHDHRLRCRTPEHPALRRLRGRRARLGGRRTAERPDGCWPTEHHRQATRSPARVRPAAPNRPPDLRCLAVDTAREPPRHRPARQPIAHERTPPQ